jgi:acyl dehydratase
MDFSRNSVGAQRWRLTPGDRLPTWSVESFNDARDSKNRMHDDTVAKQLGFAGGLVPGVTLFGYLTRPFTALFGQAFLEDAFIDVRMRRPVYEGTWVTTAVDVTEADADSATFTARLLDEAGEPCVIATVQYPARQRAATPLPPVHPLPDPRWPATPETLRQHPVFGTLAGRTSAADAAAYTRLLGDDAERFQGVVHPAWLLRQANLVIDANLALGPWIHVGSEVTFMGVVRVNEPWTARAEVLSMHTHKGREYADIDVAIGGVRTALRVRHKVIYRMEVA